MNSFFKLALRLIFLLFFTSLSANLTDFDAINSSENPLQKDTIFISGNVTIINAESFEHAVVINENTNDKKEIKQKATNTIAKITKEKSHTIKSEKIKEETKKIQSFVYVDVNNDKKLGAVTYSNSFCCLTTNSNIAKYAVPTAEITNSNFHFSSTLSIPISKNRIYISNLISSFSIRPPPVFL